MKFSRFLSALCAVFAGAAAAGAALPPPAARWTLSPDGGIAWAPQAGEAHHDTIEMSGLRVSVIVTYGVDQTGHFTASRRVVWPMLRFHPNETRDELILTFGEDADPRLFLNHAAPRFENISRLHLKGIIEVEGTYGRARDITFTRTIFPSVDRPLAIDRTVLTNRSTQDVVVEVEDNTRQVTTNPNRGIYGGYLATSEIVGAGERTLKPGESTTFAVLLEARKSAEPVPMVDLAAEEQARRARLQRVLDEMRLETPDPVLNTEFAFAKIRTTESIFATKGGLLPSPGGGEYYAAVWANDQAEYTAPFFAMLADPTAREAALNTFRQYARFMNPAYQPIPSSIISEGANIWHGAGDRGDMAMIASGASRFALARGDRAIAEEIWPLITWCLEYCRRQVTADGVVASDSDELENRFPSGRANLATSSLYYDALNSAALLGADLGKPAAQLNDYRTRATAVRAAIERYFGATVEGFATYRYFDKSVPSVKPSALARHRHYANEPDHLRAWISVTLAVGIFDRAPGTIAALFSPRLWTADGLATEAGQPTFWDRSTLYALRGVFAAGETQRALDHLIAYSNRRLLGEHVPYPVEAYPEGNQRHLAAEGSLYCRIYTEGMFGLRPTGLRSFTLTPRLPSAWPAMALRAVHAFGNTFDLTVTRSGRQLRVEIARSGEPAIVRTIADGATVGIHL